MDIANVLSFREQIIVPEFISKAVVSTLIHANNTRTVEVGNTYKSKCRPILILVVFNYSCSHVSLLFS